MGPIQKELTVFQYLQTFETNLIFIHFKKNSETYILMLLNNLNTL